MKRVAVLLAGIAVIALLPGIVAASGLFGLPGLPSFGGFGKSMCGSCEEPCGPKGGFTGYVGYGTAPNLGFTASTNDLGIGGVTQLEQHYTTTGVWVGAGLPLQIAPNVGFLGTGWYLIQTGTDRAEENFTAGAVALFPRIWDNPKTEWWYADGVLTFGSYAGAAFVAGARYEYFTTSFKSSTINAANPLVLPTDQANLDARNIIPLFGIQYSCASKAAGDLLLRVVGVPTLVGRAVYTDTLGGLGSQLQASGNWDRGYFLEIFSEYSWRFGPGELGAFGRYNFAYGHAPLSVSIDPVGLTGSGFELTLNRQSWAGGAKVSFDFNTPMSPF
jgi:hypothetical protein